MAFNRQGRSNDRGAGRSFGGDRQGGGRSYGGNRGAGPELFDVTCAQCGTQTQVPFKPTGARPVLCRSCFNGGGGAPQQDSAPRSAPRGNGGDSSRELREINEKLDKIMQALDIE